MGEFHQLHDITLTARLGDLAVFGAEGSEKVATEAMMAIIALNDALDTLIANREEALAKAFRAGWHARDNDTGTPEYLSQLYAARTARIDFRV